MGTDKIIETNSPWGVEGSSHGGVNVRAGSERIKNNNNWRRQAFQAKDLNVQSHSWSLVSSLPYQRLSNSVRQKPGVYMELVTRNEAGPG